MRRRHLLVQLSDSRGLGEVVVFTGLRYPVVVHPMLHGEPLLTAQPFYYLNQLEAVAHLCYFEGDPELTESQREYLIDNYLFEFSRREPESRMTARLSAGRFWVDDPDALFSLADERQTETLTIDGRGDPRVLYLRKVATDVLPDTSSWDIGRNTAQQALEAHIAELDAVLNSRIEVGIAPTEERDGYVGKLPVIKAGEGLLNYFQARDLEHVSINTIRPGDKVVRLTASGSDRNRGVISIRRVVATKEHDPVLLSHFFSGLKELNPIKAFVGFYNVLEYYFEEAPKLVGQAATSELQQLMAVLSLITSDADLRVFFAGRPSSELALLCKAVATSTAVPIPPLCGDLQKVDCGETARWLYAIRCACVHSKKTRRGKPAPAFVPYSEQASGVALAIPLVRFLAISCIEKDHALRNP
jgi:hypothetical protein